MADVMSPAWAIVREARRMAGLSQRELARKARTGQSVVARIERGRMEPTLSLVLRLVRACGLDLRIRIDPYDDQPDALIDHTLAMSVEDRVRAVESAILLAVEAGDGR